MTDAWNWLVANWETLAASGGVLALAVTLAGRIVELTPTPKDNAVFAAVMGFLKIVGLKVGPANPDNK